MGQKNMMMARILLAAVEIVKNEGSQNATVKRVAALARVNEAAISYYCCSKDNLIRAAQSMIGHGNMEQALQQIVDDRHDRLLGKISGKTKTGGFTDG